MSSIPQYNPLDPEILNNPYPCYHNIRTHDPVHWNKLLNAWMCMAYNDVYTLYKNDSLSAKRVPAIAARASKDIVDQIQPFINSLSLWMLFCDPPDHTRIRSLVTKVFTLKFIEKMRPSIELITNELIASFIEKKHCDIIADFAYPLPVIVIADMLGIPREDRDWLKEKSNKIAAMLATPKPTDEIAQNANRCVVELNDYFRGAIDQRRKNPQADLISILINAEEQGQLLGNDEILATCTVLLFGGHETTTNLIGNGLYALIRYPKQLQQLRENPSLIPSAIEEMLRFDSPVQWNTRIATNNIEISGKKIKKGQAVILIIGSANRDPQMFPHPDKFDITRTNNKHLAFGHSIHFCLGAALARLEAQIAFKAILDKIFDIQLMTDKLQWREDLALRGLKSLPLQFNCRA